MTPAVVEELNKVLASGGDPAGRRLAGGDAAGGRPPPPASAPPPRQPQPAEAAGEAAGHARQPQQHR